MRRDRGLDLDLDPLLRCRVAERALEAIAPRHKIRVCQQTRVLAVELGRLVLVEQSEAVDRIIRRVNVLRHGLDALEELAAFGLVCQVLRVLLLRNRLIEHLFHALNVGAVVDLLHHDAHARFRLHEDLHLPRQRLAAKKVRLLLLRRPCEDIIALLLVVQARLFQALFLNLRLNLVEVLAELGERGHALGVRRV